ncbi:MarR family winged helix-turn-helix transcriptional regulator [Falsibacillus albus]|nr:MarR family transcriptional regulator [Falsibacillus albus]
MSENNHIPFIEHELAIFVRRAEATRIANLKYQDIERSTYLLLLHLEENGPMGIKSLADAFQLDLSTLSRQTSSLEAKGYVKRTANPQDARVNLLSITDIGQGQLSEVRELRQEFYSRLLMDWNDEDQEKFGELLQKFNQTVVKYKKSQ